MSLKAAFLQVNDQQASSPRPGCAATSRDVGKGTALSARGCRTFLGFTLTLQKSMKFSTVIFFLEGLQGNHITETRAPHQPRQRKSAAGMLVESPALQFVVTESRFSVTLANVCLCFFCRPLDGNRAGP